MAAPKTPMMQQYLAFKEQYPKEIVFFRLGDFYEMFGDDATLVSGLLGLTLTGRGKDENRIPMCGVPFHAAEQYIAKLVKFGHKVVICEQTEAITDAGISQRKVSRILSPGTVLSEHMLSPDTPNYLMAISGDKVGNWGLAYTDCSTGELRVQIGNGDPLLFDAIDRIQASECFIQQELYAKLSEKVERSESYVALRDDMANDAICELLGIADLRIFGLETIPVVYPAIWGIFDYLKRTHHTLLPQFTRISIDRPTDTLQLDGATIAHLELLHCAVNNEKKGTLFHILNRCQTPMGTRRLRDILIHPFADERVLNERLDAVEYFIKEKASQDPLRQQLKSLVDIPRVLTRIVSNIHSPKDCLDLAQSILLLPDLCKELENTRLPKALEASASQLRELRPGHPVYELGNTLSASIAQDAPTHIRQIGFIRPEASEKLAQLLASFESVRTWISNLETIEREATGIKTLKVGFNKVFGYYLEAGNIHSEKVPAHYIRKQTLRNAERYITQELKEKEEILLSGEAQQLEIEQAFFRELLTQIQPHISAIQDIAMAVAELDVFAALANTAQERRYVRPNFVVRETKELTLKEARHPVLEQDFTQHFIPNSIHLAKDDPSFVLLTGPNMAGKSTIMRQVALIVIMAQMGSFVPATEARLSIVDQILTRIGASDFLVKGQSTFMVEMIETARILHHATENSLIVLDEIGRGTSTYDGLSIAEAVSTHIIKEIGARCFFATHYHELSTLAETHDCVQSFHMGVKESNNNIHFTYQLSPGSADKSYGVHVADMAGVPKSVIQYAQRRLAELESDTSDDDTPQMPTTVKSKAPCPGPKKAVELEQLPLF